MKKMRKTPKIEVILETHYSKCWETKYTLEKATYRNEGAMTILEEIFKEVYNE